MKKYSLGHVIGFFHSKFDEDFVEIQANFWRPRHRAMGSELGLIMAFEVTPNFCMKRNDVNGKRKVK